jgi:hypothetical protein
VDRKAEGGQAPIDVLYQPVFATEKMRAAGDIQHQAVVAVQCHQRCVTITPVGDSVEQRAVGGGIRLDHVQARTDGTGFRQSLPDPEAESLGCLIQCRDTHGVGDPAGTGQRRIFRMRGRAGG